jgi:REP element-mobilizing transposase RayT
LDAPGTVHHVIARGIERGKIFRTDADRAHFLERLEHVTQGDKAFVYAWSLIPNHFHLAIRTGTERLSTIMRRLMTGYAVAYNRRYKRHGHLFQNRYKSIVVDDEAYLLGLVRYIHLNPLRAKLVKSVVALSRYPWAGHAALMGNVENGFQDIDEILGRFGRRLRSAREHLAAFMSDLQTAKKEERLFKGGGLVRSAGGMEQLRKTTKDERQLYDERILGDGQFVQGVLEQAELQDRLSQADDSKREAQFEVLQSEICKRLKVDPRGLQAGSRARQVTLARMIVAYVAGRYLGWTGKELAERLGVTPAAISQALNNGEPALIRIHLEPKVFLDKLN